MIHHHGFWILVFFSSAAFGTPWDGKIVDTKAGKAIDNAALYEALAPMENVALGEKHYTAPVQKAQAAVIAGVVKAARRQGRFTVGWEFLIRSRREETRKLFARFMDGEITAREFLAATQGADGFTPPSPLDVPQGEDGSESYGPILETIRELRGELIGVNLSREEKRPAVKGGLAAMDPKLVPPGFKLGGKGYFERFQEALAGIHGTTLDNYFVAQCLTDAWLAHGLLTDANHDLRFLVAGSFHVDYRDGAVAELYQRGKKAFTRSVRFVDSQDHTAAELQALVSHSKYGDLADYVVYVGEPAAQ